ncbi:uncharacterized protein LOC123555071 [Mercenaria mercenaria]|uniref:uncharacterized protein LOC123555071 n=1 Tax=Mercenaria mercenaria TaxID=6596 RepID=UPI00234F66B6|nr:uncharacterized protein LOC123555071 [Mercenaria mercenaria]
MEPSMIQTVTAIVSLFILIQLCTSAGYDEACTDNSACTEANTYCQASVSPTCNKGTCKCLRHMVWDANHSKCKVKKYYHDKCNMTLTACQGGSECSVSDGQCMCNGDTNFYYASLQKCIDHTPTWKVIGEDCTTVDDCYQEISGAVKCAIPTGSTGSQKKCTCAPGYIEDRSSCRKPHYGESCTTTVDCAQEIALSETSVVVETCSNTSPKICTCPTGSTEKSIERDGLIASICLTDSTGTLLSKGTACQAYNECETSKCMMCPEDTSKKCVAAPSS